MLRATCEIMSENVGNITYVQKLFHIEVYYVLDKQWWKISPRNFWAISPRDPSAQRENRQRQERQRQSYHIKNGVIWCLQTRVPRHLSPVNKLWVHKFPNSKDQFQTCSMKPWGLGYVGRGGSCGCPLTFVFCHLSFVSCRCPLCKSVRRDNDIHSLSKGGKREKSELIILFRYTYCHK